MLRSLTFFLLPGNKTALMPNPLMEKEPVVFTNVTMSAYHAQLNAGFSKGICKVHNKYSLKYVAYI